MKLLTLMVMAAAGPWVGAQAQSSPKAASAPLHGPVYRCPGPPVLYTDALSPKEAKDKGCPEVKEAPVPVDGVVSPPPRTLFDLHGIERVPEQPPKAKRELGAIDRWRFESCMQDANKAPTALGVRSGQILCNEKFGQ